MIFKIFKATQAPKYRSGKLGTVAERDELARELRALRKEPGFLKAWVDARLDHAAEREVRFCKEAKFPFIPKELQQAGLRLRSPGTRTALEQACYVAFGKAWAFHMLWQIREEVMQHHRIAGGRAAGMVVLGR